MTKIIAMLSLSAALAHSAAARDYDWQTSWYAAPQATWGAEFALPTNVPASLHGQTVRETVRISAGGERVRVVLSNRYGTQPLTIGAAHIARAADAPDAALSATPTAAADAAVGATAGAAARTPTGAAADTAVHASTGAAARTAADAAVGASAGAAARTSAGAATIAAGSDTPLTFGGRRTVTIAPGAEAVSDAAEFKAAALERLTVSTYFPQRTPLTTFHWGAQQTGYIVSGSVAGAVSVDTGTPLQGRAFLTAVEVLGPSTGTVVAFGDSITDGNGSTPGADRRWPDFLSRRLAAANTGMAVANAGISGARMLAGRMGERAGARFGPDVLARPGVSAVIVALGINDIGWPGSAFAPQDPVMGAGRLIAAYRELIARARARNVKIIGATMTPFEGALHGTPFAGHYSPAKDAVRREVNAWIRSGGEFDAVVDFDAVLRDPQHPARMLPAYDSGDHLHPGDAGYQAMADAIDLSLLR